MSFTGLLLTSGANLYETTSGGVLTLVDTYTGISLGAVTQGAQTSTSTTLWLLNSAGTDLYKIALSNVGGVHSTTNTHVGSLGVTGVGLAYLGGTLYTLVYNGTYYDLYTVSTSSGSASLSHTTTLSTLDNLTTDSTDLFLTETIGTVYKLTTGGTLSSGGSTYQYSPGSDVSCDLAAFDGTNFWFVDNTTKKLSYGPSWTNGGTYTVTVDFTYNTTYNGMCWGFVPW